MVLIDRTTDRSAAVGLLRNTGGLAAVELALVLPIIVLLLGGAVDLTRLATQRLQVRAAAQAGADYVLRKGWDASAVSNSILSSTSLAVSAFPTPQVVTGCLSGSVIVQTTSVSCPNGAVPSRYVVSSARASFTPLMPWTSIVLPTNLDGAAFARIE